MKPLNLIPSYYGAGEKGGKVRLAFIVHEKAEQSWSTDNQPVLTVAVSVVQMIEGDKVRGICCVDAFDDLQLTCRAYAKLDSCPHWEIEYGQAYCLDLRKLEAKYGALKKIHGALEKLAAEFGYAKTFGQYVNRAAVVLGIEKVITYRKGESYGSNWDDQRHLFQYWSPGEAVGTIDCRIDNWLQEQRNPTPVSEDLAHCVTE